MVSWFYLMYQSLKEEYRRRWYLKLLKRAYIPHVIWLLINLQAFLRSSWKDQYVKFVVWTKLVNIQRAFNWLKNNFMHACKWAVEVVWTYVLKREKKFLRNRFSTHSENLFIILGPVGTVIVIFFLCAQKKVAKRLKKIIFHLPRKYNFWTEVDITFIQFLCIYLKSYLIFKIIMPEINQKKSSWREAENLVLKAVADLGSPPSGFRTPDYPNCPPFGTIFVQFWLYDLEIIVKAPTVPVKTIFKGGARAEKTIVWSKLTKKCLKAFFWLF